MTTTTTFDEIFAFDKRIRFCAIIDERGGVLKSRSRESLSALLPEAEDNRLFSQIGLAVLMDRGWDKFFGTTKAIAIAKEKVNILVYSLADMRAIVIATDPDLPLAYISDIGKLVDVLGLVGPERHAAASA